MKQFFEVVAKCGHVGKKKYYLGTFYEIAESGKEAAMIVRGRGRVKHNKKDAILSVKKISFEEYQEGVMKKNNNPYFNCKNIQDQNLILDFINDNIMDEERFQNIVEIDMEERKVLIKYKKQKNKQKIQSYNRYLWQEYAV